VEGHLGQIIDISKRLKGRNSEEKAKNEKPAEVLDMQEAREEILNSERRVVKRTLLTEFVGAFAVIPEKGLLKVALYDISQNGVAFNTEGVSSYFHEGQEVAMRVYLNHKTYFPFVVRMRNKRFITAEGVFRCGADFLAGTNDLALQHFVKFIENVSATLKTDNGDIQVPSQASR
jgi:c-di-GMP-binding flagellar brake protein YcgR